MKSVDSEHKDFSKADYAKLDRESTLGKVGLEIQMENGEKGNEDKKQKAPNKNEKPKPIQKSNLVRLARLSELDKKPELLFSTDNIDIGGDRLLSWHAAHLQDGMMLTIPAGIDAGQIVIRERAQKSSALHHIFILEKGAKAKILLVAEGQESDNNVPSLHTDLTEAFLDEDSHLSLTTIQDYAQSDLAFSHHFHTLKKFAKLSHTAASLGAGLSRTRALNHLYGVRSHVDSYQIFACEDAQRMDMGSLSHHAINDTSAKMTCRGALTGQSIGIYKGKIKIDRSAPDTVSHQSGSALLLSSQSKAYIIPALEVDNDQVEAGHGASIGGLDRGELTYLRSRGLSEDEAKRLLLTGFFDSLRDLNESEAARETLGELLKKRLAGW